MKTYADMTFIEYNTRKYHAVAILQVWWINVTSLFGHHSYILTSSSGTYWALNQHEDFDQYGPYDIPPKLMQYYISLTSMIDEIKDLSSKYVKSLTSH